MDMSVRSKSSQPVKSFQQLWIKRYLLFSCLLILICSSVWLVSANIFNGKRDANTSPSFTTLQLPGDAIVSRHSITANSGSRVEGSVRQLSGDNTTINGGTITGDFLVPGTPSIRINSIQAYNGTTEDIGSALPANYNITLNGTTALRHIAIRNDAISIANVPAPPAATGTNNVAVNQPNPKINFATLRNLTLNSNVGDVAIPPGTYGIFTANTNSNFIFGVADSSDAVVYNLQGLTLNSAAKLKVVGPVIINVANQVTINSQSVMGNADTPILLSLNVANGDVVLNSQATIYGVVRAPQNRVTINSQSKIKGLIICNQVVLNSGALVQGLTTDLAPPGINITQPADNATTNQTSVLVKGDFNDESVTTVKVNNINATLNGTSFSTNVPLNLGANTITAVATDAFGHVAQKVVHVTRADGANQAPQVNAGNDQTVTLPSDATLTGSVSDDNLPNNSLTSTWSKVSGPGTVTFGNANQAATTATFSTQGTYTLRLTASDGVLTSSDDCVITVNPPPPTNQAPVVNAGDDQSLNFEDSLFKNGGNETELINGEIANWNEVNGHNWTQAVADQNSFPIAQEGNTYFYAGETASAELKQDVDVSIFANDIDANTQQFSFRGFIRTADEATPDTTQVIVEYRNAANSSVLATYDSGAINSITEWLKVADLRTAPAGTRWIRVRLIGQRNSGTTLDAYFDNLTLRPVSKAWTSITGIVSDDGLPVNSTLTTTWSKVSGPGNVLFADANQVATKASFDAAGIYVLRLSATDAALTTSDDLTITITANNQAPTVNAGSDQNVTLPNSANLIGMVNDDGLPAGSALSITWSKVSGEGEVTFGNSSAAITTASFSVAGTYVLRLEANDGLLIDDDEVVISVFAAQENQPPTVTAGEDFSITLPANATLHGLVTDDGLPQGARLSTIWSKVSGEGEVTFVDATALSTRATFSIAGTYRLRLTANDTEFTAFDELIINVLPAAENQAPVVNAGVDQTITLPNTITLTGQATDDGLPVNSTLVYTWSKVSGPGDVTFENEHAAITGMIFSQLGTYILRLSVSDGLLTGQDEITLRLNQRQLIVVHSDETGLSQDQLSVPAGDKLLMIRNRSGLDNLTYIITQNGQSTTLNVGAGGNGFIYYIMTPGQVVITEQNHSDWQYTITVTE